ncbi:MAG: hypothetical protein LBK13_11760 [Spirochaetales bacterium]|nr:hypothetical protein [Spirochaetales bacterium]
MTFNVVYGKASGTPVSLIPGENNNFTFTMPAANVRISVEFGEDTTTFYHIRCSGI